MVIAYHHEELHKRKKRDKCQQWNTFRKHDVHSVEKDQKVREAMNKLKEVSERLATELDKYQLVDEEEDHNGLDQVEEDLEWNYFQFPSVGSQDNFEGRTNVDEHFEEKEEEENEEEMGDEAEEWLLRDLEQER